MRATAGRPYGPVVGGVYPNLNHGVFVGLAGTQALLGYLEFQDGLAG